MIKLGQLAEQAMNKSFPDNWKTMAIMMNVPFTMYDDDKEIEIEFSDTDILSIKADNSVSVQSPLPNETIAQLIVDIATKVDKK